MERRGEFPREAGFAAGSPPRARLSGACLANLIPQARVCPPRPPLSFIAPCGLRVGTNLDPESVCSNGKRIVFLPGWRCFLPTEVTKGSFHRAGAGLCVATRLSALC